MGNRDLDMAEAMCHLFGWEELGTDPWGSASSYLTWALPMKGNKRVETFALYATGMTRGLEYLATFICGQIYRAVDFTKLDSKVILQELEWAYFVEDCIRRHGVPEREEGGWLIDYSTPLHPSYIKYLLEREYPFSSLFGDTGVVMDGRLALKEEIRRGYDPSLANYIVAESPSLQRAMKALYPRDPVPDKNESFRHLWESVESDLYRRQGDESEVQASIFQLLHEVATGAFEPGDSQEAPPSDKPWPVETQSMKALRTLDDLQAANLDKKLANYFSTVAYHDRADRGRREKQAESRLWRPGDTSDGSDPTEEALDASAYRAWEQRPVDEEAGEGRLEDLNLPMGRLTAKEVAILQDVHQALGEGFSFDSKKGMSFRQRWGKNYESTRKAWQRVRANIRRS